jgi:hypothetical protein
MNEKKLIYSPISPIGDYILHMGCKSRNVNLYRLKLYLNLTGIKLKAL